MTILTKEQRERVGREVVLRAKPGATADELIDATCFAAAELERLAASAAIWELWQAEQVEVSWNEPGQTVSLHPVDPLG